MTLRLALCSGAVGQWSIDRVAEASAEAGFAAVEWDLRPGGPHIDSEDAAAGARRCANAAQAQGLPVCAVSASADLSLLDVTSVATLVAACQEAGARIGRMFAPPIDRTIPLATQLDAVSEALGAHADGYAAHGITLVIELSQETLIPSPELLIRACEGLDPHAVGALYDPANMVVEGNLHPWLALEVFSDYLHHVHVKNEAFLPTDRGWAEAVVQLDTGLVDWPAVFGELDDRDYGGWIAVDHLAAEATEKRLTFEKELVDAMWSKRGMGSALSYRA
jgi:sugar phosphate isomerase/epimerase